MLIANVTREGLQYALDTANGAYEGNLRFRECELKRTNRKGQEVWHVQLTVRSRAERERCADCELQRTDRMHTPVNRCDDPQSNGRKTRKAHKCPNRHHRYRKGQSTAGVAKSRMGDDRYNAAACWHAHGVFFDGLNADAVIKSGSMHRDGAFGTGGRWLRADEYKWRDGMGDAGVGSMMCPMNASECCDCDGYAPNVNRYMPQVIRATAKLTKAIPVRLTARDVAGFASRTQTMWFDK